MLKEVKSKLSSNFNSFVHTQIPKRGFPRKLCTHTHKRAREERFALFDFSSRERERERENSNAPHTQRRESSLCFLKSEKKFFFHFISCVFFEATREFVTKKIMSQFKREHSAGARVFVFLLTVVAF